jgi:MarR family transcriptional regulator, negative regulator of the multidrug operon emrRAB
LHPTRFTLPNFCYKLRRLTTIGYEPGLANDLLRQALGLTHSGTVRLIDRLQREGLVERQPGHDRRTIALHLTQAGWQAREKLLQRRLAVLVPLIAGLSEIDAVQLDATLDKLLQNLPSSEVEAYHICRLCDETTCGACPVEKGVTVQS